MKNGTITLERLIDEMRSIDDALNSGNGGALVADAASEIPAIGELFGCMRKSAKTKKKRKKYEIELQLMYRDFLVLLAVHNLAFKQDEVEIDFQQLRREKAKLN